MGPRVHKTEFVPGVSRPDLHEMAVAYAMREFAVKGEAPFMWIIAAGPNLMWIETPWRDEREKELFVRTIRGAMQELGARAYSFITEAWMATYSDKDPKPGEPGFLNPSERPESQRDDVLMITTYDDAGAYDATRFLVTIRERGLNFLGPRDDQSLRDHQMTGRMFNLLVR